MPPKYSTTADVNSAEAAAVASPTGGSSGTSALEASAHAPSAAGSVIEATDVLSGNKLLIRIQNIASTANLGVRLDLKKIALKCRNTEFNPRCVL